MPHLIGSVNSEESSPTAGAMTTAVIWFIWFLVFDSWPELLSLQIQLLLRSMLYQCLLDFFEDGSAASDVGTGAEL